MAGVSSSACSEPKQAPVVQCDAERGGNRVEERWWGRSGWCAVAGRNDGSWGRQRDVVKAADCLSAVGVV